VDASQKKFIVHDDPVLLGLENYVAHVDLAPFGFPDLYEQIWLNPVSPDVYQVGCVPFRVYGMALLDEVRISSDGKYVESIVKTSGHRVIRVLLGQSGAPTAKRAVGNLLDSMDVLYEWSGERHVAIDVPPGVDIARLSKVIGAMVDAGEAHWEWGDSAPFVSGSRRGGDAY
jgi:hypothetical protein